MADTAFTIIEAAPGEWRSADIDMDGMPLRLRFHTDASISPEGAIYMGRVTRVDKTLDMAFLELGGETGNLTFRRARALASGKADGIADCVREGDLIKVQVAHDTDGADGKTLALSARPRLLGRYVVAETGKPRVNISKDISAKKTKALTEALSLLGAEVALIVRSSADDVPQDAVVAEAKLLADKLATASDTPGLLHVWSLLETSLLNTPFGDTPVYAENGSLLTDLKTKAAAHWPDLTARLALWKGETKAAAFEECGVEEAIEEALSERIDLPCGGWINITPTPALIAVDVNMGAALEGRAASEAKLVVNMEATLALAFHMQFQDLGGLIVVDYIDMSTKGHAKELMDLIDKVMRADSVPVQHTGISMFGLVEFTRKRTGLSLKDRYFGPARRTAKPAASALALLRKASKLGTTSAPGLLVLKAPQAVLSWLEDHTDFLDSLKTATSRSVNLREGSPAEVYLESD